MTEYILSELRFLGWSMLLGVKLGAIYEGIVLLRKVVHHYQLMMAIEDISYWLYAALMMYFTICMANSGKMRAFSIIGMFFALILTSIILKKAEKKATIIYTRFKERRVFKDGKGKTGTAEETAAAKKAGDI